MTKVYLAIPYSGMKEESVYIANKVCAWLMKQNYLVFNPIGHSHYLALQEDLPTDWRFWMRQDLPFIEWADEVFVVDLEAEIILDSIGVQEEVKYAQKLGKPVKLINPISYELRDYDYQEYSHPIRNMVAQ